MSVAFGISLGSSVGLLGGSGVGGEQSFERLRCRAAEAQEVERRGTVREVGERLRGHRTHLRFHPDDAADLEPVRLDRDAQLAGLPVAGNDRVGHDVGLRMASGPS